MNQLRMGQLGEARQLEAKLGERTARDFLARSLAWERRLTSLRAGEPMVAEEASTRVA